jgi:hypothetical protein
VRTVRRLYAETASATLSIKAECFAVSKARSVEPSKQRRRGRPPADLNAAEVARLREEFGMGWRSIAKKLSADASAVRRAYSRASTTAQCVKTRPSPWQNSNVAIPANDQMLALESLWGTGKLQCGAPSA